MKRQLLALLVLVGLGTGCATADSFNKLAANTTRDSITATENSRCSVHPTPCLSDDQFKEANAYLFKVSAAGKSYTELRIAGKATTKDASTFLATIAEQIANLSKAFPDGVVASALSKLTDLQKKAIKLIGG